MREPLIFEISRPGRHGVTLPDCDVPEKPIDELLGGAPLRQELNLPEVAQIDLMRHFVRLSQMNFSIDTNFYPLGSCTMKYNPKVHEDVARYAGFADLHPYQDDAQCQGALRLMYELQGYLAEIAGMDAVSLQPAAGAHGELTGVLIIRAFHLSREDRGRRRILVPDSAHGTNPATAAICGFEVTSIDASPTGGVDLEDLRAKLGPDVAGLMITIPSTLGLFDENILEVTELVHRAGGLVYCDGANLNAVVGRARFGDLGGDVMHFNLHKTFTTPHGGGGPGAGPVGVKAHLAPFLPAPLVARRGDQYVLDYDRPLSIGRVRSFNGNFAMLVRAYTYIRMLGADGLRQVSDDAVLNANYVLSHLKRAYDLPYDRTCMHEFVLSARAQKAHGVRALDVAKRMMDYGYHPPTIYFPLVVDEALMIEPTETESKETLDAFVEAMLRIADEARENPELLRDAPHVTPVRRLDEVAAARHPNIRYATTVER
ncbi:MAG TPA: aminomethyl-transferring glycine dehydrogenase subunit GcvPB [Chloroflexota bacterium]|nr:aminomethyl-transferring glycine dehydrogenase subunit GcvPB [Chloroflexota bacterium]